MVAPLTRDGLTGVTEIDINTAAVIVRLVDCVTTPIVAVIVVRPAVIDVANPFDPSALLMVATPALDEFQVTVVVKFWVDPSEYVPVAVNCRFVPLAILELAGVIASDTSVAPVTVNIVVPEILPNTAVIVLEPTDTGVVNPLKPAALLMEATPALEELQVTMLVKFCVVLSEYVPVAVNC